MKTSCSGVSSSAPATTKTIAGWKTRLARQLHRGELRDRRGGGEEREPSPVVGVRERETETARAPAAVPTTASQ